MVLFLPENPEKTKRKSYVEDLEEGYLNGLLFIVKEERTWIP
jgi:hypothetical protein